ncbi:MAG: PD40 domain-containing protein [Acutalibacter sp.]|nr:PD40 domain-containing protein [Acutalibacter sp.]
MKFGIQLYGPLNNMKGDLLENLRALAAAGISEIEPCVAIDPMPGQEKIIWPVSWLLEHGEEIKAMGLEIKSAHVFAADLAGSVDTVKALAKKLGLRQVAAQMPAPLTEVSLHHGALVYTKAAEELRDAGIALLLHNGEGNCRTKFGGQTAYEKMLDLCMGKVFAQVDVGWVQFDGEDPAEFLHRNAYRVKSIHYKDFLAGSGEPVDVPIGAGAVDVAACFSLAQAREIPQLIDQEHFGGDVPHELMDICKKLNGLTYHSRANTVSYLNTYDIETGEIKTLARFDRVIEAPNWLKKRDVILFNSDGHMYSFDIKTGTETVLDTGICNRCNNDHVVSPDENFIAVSHADSDAGYASRVYIVPMGGGEARLVTPNSPSYLHGWSPDGKELAYCAFREVNGKLEVDVYAIPAEGGEERRLTAGGFNDGPEYSPDGKYIWYNSTKSGLMQVWRMDRDGGNPVQMTKNHRNNWFGHVSPDGEKVAYLSYGPEQLEPQEHLPNMPVELWLMDANGGNQQKILSLFGGQGSLNVNSWAGDSKHFAFVTYELP